MIITFDVYATRFRSGFKIKGETAKLLSIKAYKNKESSIPVAGMKREAEMLLFFVASDYMEL